MTNINNVLIRTPLILITYTISIDLFFIIYHYTIISFLFVTVFIPEIIVGSTFQLLDSIGSTVKIILMYIGKCVFRNTIVLSMHTQIEMSIQEGINF